MWIYIYNEAKKTAIVGFNGMGKTTLLRLLADRHPLSEGTRRLGHNVVIGYQSQEFSDTFNAHQSIFHSVKEAKPDTHEHELRALLGSFGFSADAIHKPFDVLSGGEKIRLAFARIFIRPPNLLLLDEPTTHLDIGGRKALEKSPQELYRGRLFCESRHRIHPEYRRFHYRDYT